MQDKVFAFKGCRMLYEPYISRTFYNTKRIAIALFIIANFTEQAFTQGSAGLAIANLEHCLAKNRAQVPTAVTITLQ